MLKKLKVQLFSLFLVLLFAGNSYAAPLNAQATVVPALTFTEQAVS